MSMMLNCKSLNFVDGLLTMGRNLEKVGLLHQACQIYRRLANLRQLSPEIAEETQHSLGRLQLERGNFTKARRHLTAALVYQPANAHYHYLLASAIEQDPQGNPERAAQHFRRCLELDPANPLYLLEFARHLLGKESRDEGLAMLRQAWELGSHDANIVRQVVEELREHNEWQEAGTLLKIASFRNPRDQRFRQLWSEHQFQLLWQQQQQDKMQETSTEEEPRLLPFTPAATPRKTHIQGGRILRHDPPANQPGPNRRISRRLPR